eukprot:TRINITY_DN10764_c0_g1_i4.p1 TRINITY_DN10764_c0_g1~~TRINITY_DN10764_c0_g1_i4.p1  ORF type:complete len:249 (+),score=31.01 TRINITY_DN10764_c0_g1_i4:228-974(+)
MALNESIINPCVLLKPDREVTLNIDSQKDTPNRLLQYRGKNNHRKYEFMESQGRRIRHTEHLVEVLEKNLSTNLYVAAKRAIQQFKAKSETDDHSNEGQLQEMLSKKCDFSELQPLNDLKANKIDLERLQRYTEQLNEFMHIIVSDIKKSKAKELSKLSLVIQQLSLLYKSITAKMKGRPIILIRQENRSHTNFETYDEPIQFTSKYATQGKINNRKARSNIKPDLYRESKEVIRHTASQSKKVCYKK